MTDEQILIEPHVHMLSRTTDEYDAMYRAGIRACVEPSFWLGENRRWAESFWDYFNLILNFETVRARRAGIDHFAAIGMNPKESENLALADRVIDGMAEYLEHPRCVALGEIGFNNITPNEEKSLVRQLRLAEERQLPVVLHLPHFQKAKGIRRVLEIIRAEGLTASRIDIDHNVEETIGLALEAGCFAGMTVYPFSKLSPERVSAIIRQHGSERVIVNGSADWGVSDPLSLVKVRDRLRADGHAEATIRAVVFDNANRFYSLSPHWQPDFTLLPVDPATYQRQP
ncbi:MAG: TatD family hydrolase [Kiritimatiellia bacterium]